MKIKYKLTFRYTSVTALVFSIAMLLVFFFSEHSREDEFFRDLTREAVTKANLYFSGKVDAETMQSIYRNNRQFINEVEMALYTVDSELLYHDAQDIDIIKETPDLINSAINHEQKFYEGKYQAIAMKYPFEGKDYILTAAAYDGNGYSKLNRLTSLLLILWLIGLMLSGFIGYLLAGRALRPINKIVNDVDDITESRLNTRLNINKDHDEIDELSGTFNLMLDRLEKSFNNQKMFVSNVAHELRTPLATLIAELEIALLREQRTGDEYKIIITNALSDARNIQHLITGLLDLAKADYDASQITTENLRMDELLIDARETVLKSNNNYNINITFEQDDDDDSKITVKGNEYLLKTAFANLIENNCKYSNNGTSAISLSFNDVNTIIRFSDMGMGISDEEKEKIFIPFYRGKNGVGIKGQGIGLTLTKKIVALHRGAISVESSHGEGTTFVIKIPHI